LSYRRILKIKCQSQEKIKGGSGKVSEIIGGIFSWLNAPLIAAYLIIPGFFRIINSSSSLVIGQLFNEFALVNWKCNLWMGLRHLGVSLGSSIVLGLCPVFGAIIPS
jgi:L-rhamnose-H+ transport protein